MSERWVASRKVEVLTAIETGKLSIEEALQRYDLSAEELAEWQRAYAEHGRYGLRVTRIQFYRGKTTRFRR